MVSKPNQDFLPFVEENEFLPPISRWTTVGGLFMVGAVGVAIAVASFTQYKVTVKAQANIRPTGELRLVQAATEGAVRHISIQENQPVKRGDVITTLDDSRLQTKKSQLQSQIQQAILQLAQLKAQIRAIDTQIFAESDRSGRAVISAQAELSGKQRDYRDKKITTTTELQEAQANLNSAQQDWQKAQKELQSAQANLKSSTASLNAARTKRDRYGTAAQLGALSQDQLAEVQLAVEQQEQAVQAQLATVEAQKKTIAERHQAVQAALARRERAQAALNPTQAEVSIASERIAQEKATGKATLATLSKEREALIQQQIELQKKLDRDERELRQIEIDIRQTTIKATADGIIAKLNLRNPGQTVRSGEEIAQIVPGNSPLVLKAAVSPQDIGKLAVGQPVQMRVSACPYPDYGTLKGVVSQISQDTNKSSDAPAVSATTATPTATQQTAFYQVTIKPASLVLGKGNNQCAVQLGMEGRADIISREETVLQFLLRKARLITDF